MCAELLSTNFNWDDYVSLFQLFYGIAFSIVQVYVKFTDKNSRSKYLILFLEVK